MKLAKPTLLLVTLVTVSVLSSSCVPKEDTAKEQEVEAKRFFCGEDSGVPTTIGTTDSGKKVPVIRWTSKTFDAVGWTQDKRCDAVSERFELYREQGRLKYLTTGRMNGQPVICTTDSDKGACDGLVYTLKPNQDPTETLKALLEVKDLEGGPLNETKPRLYIKMQDVLDNRERSFSGSLSGISNSSQPSKESLW